MTTASARKARPTTTWNLQEIWVAVVAAIPPTLAALLGYLGNRRAIRRSVGNSPGVPLSKIVARIDSKVDALVEGQAAIRERLARLEGRRGRG